MEGQEGQEKEEVTLMLKFEGNALLFNGKRIPPSIRTFSQMRSVLAHPELEGNFLPDAPLYYMYRQVGLFSSIRYDITRVLPVDLCGERNKTFGHSHPGGWPEAYEVLEGSAHFLLQKMKGDAVDEALLLAAKKGDCFLVPPGYGHITINPGKKELIMANLVSGKFESDYSLFEQKHGACFYEMSDGKIVKNRNYPDGFAVKREAAVKFSSQYKCFDPFRKKSLLEAAKNFAGIEFLEKPSTFC